jgi:hypothetical protein
MEIQCNNCKSLWTDDVGVHCRTNKISESKQACGRRRRGTCMRPVLTNRVASIKPTHCMKTHQLPVGQQLRNS